MNYFRASPKVFTRSQSENSTASPEAEDRDEGLNVQEPADCIGVWYRKMGSAECWEATGAVRETFKDLSKDIKNYLKDWGELGDPVVTWSIYMIGKTKSTAIPTLLFCCSERGPRKSIKSQILESGILSRYPGVRVGDCSKSPDFGRVIPLIDPQDSKEEKVKLLTGDESTVPYLHGNEDFDKTVFIHPTHLLSGSRIFGANMQTATAGASFQLYGRYFVITIGHLFTQQDQPSDLDPDSDSEFEFEIPGVECGTLDLAVGDSELDDCPLSSNLPTRDRVISKDELIKLGSVVFSATDAGHPGLDFSLVEIDQGYLASSDAAIFAGLPDYNSVKRQVAPEPTDRYVKAVTASNHVLEGRLSGTPAFIRCSGSVGFQEVWAVRFNSQLNQGDCGSLVTGLDGDVIHGHIIAGCPAAGAAYIVPAAQTFNCLDNYIVVPQDAKNHPATPPYERKMLGISPQNAANHPATPLYEREWLENSWHPEFSILRLLHDDEKLVEFKKEVDADGDDLGIFFMDHLDTASPCEIEVFEDFCRGISFKEVAKGAGTAGTRRAVWLDDRGNSLDLEGGGDARQYENPLTATGLYRALERPRFNHEDLPDAARRLIYITDLDPACIHALAATASCHQTPVLRNAIYKYLAFQTAIAVKIPSDGFLTFQLDLHLPFFLLRKSTPPEESAEKVNTKPQRQWTDLSFLKLDMSEPQDPKSKEVWGIHEAQTSCVITGSDEWRWVGYGFVDTEIDGFLTDKDDLSFDQIAAEEIDATKPIWRPRGYWLKVFEIRIEQVRKEWEYLIYKVELSINQYINKHPFTLSRRSETARERAIEIKEAFNWTVLTMGLLRRLDSVLSDTVEAWKSFNSPGEDINYFYNTDVAAISPQAHRSLHTIKAIFRQIERNQKKIAVLNKCCSDFSRALQLRLILESKETAEDNVVTSEFTVSVLYPVALAAVLFSMQQEVIPFDLNPRSFVLAVVLLIALVYVIRHAVSRWPFLRGTIISWIKTAKLERDSEPLESRFQDRFPPMVGSYPDRIICDEERNDTRA